MRNLNKGVKNNLLALNVVVLCFTLLSGCEVTKDEFERFQVLPDVEPIKASIRTALPLAYATSVAFAEINGEDIPNVEVTPGCNSFPCAAIVTVDFTDEVFPQFSFSAGGYVRLAGYWTGPRQAVMAATFIDVTVGSINHLALSISTFPVMSNADGLTLLYGGVDIDVVNEPHDPTLWSDQEIQSELDRLGTPRPDSVEVAVAMKVFIIDVEMNDTALDFSDDRYIISGGGQFFHVNNEQISFLQLGMLFVEMKPDCALNPQSGIASIQALDAPRDADGTTNDYPVIGGAVIGFHDQCDGQGEILLATGNYIGTIGRNVALDLTTI